MWKLDTSSKKFRCPACGRTRMVRFVNEAGEYADEEFGRCDREQSCGYMLRPETERSADWRPVETPALLLPTYHAIGDMNRTLLYDRLQETPFFQFHEIFIGTEKLLQAAKKYNVGTTKYWDVVYWQIDGSGNIRAGKCMKYDTNGHRCKTGGATSWIHKVLEVKDFSLEQVFFGTHLLKSNDSVVVIVESEKTALLMSTIYTAYVWLACGSKSNLRNCFKNTKKELAARNIIMCADIGCEEEWMSIAMEFSHFESVGQETFNGNKGDDIWDDVLASITESSKVVTTWKYSPKQNDTVAV